MTDTGRSVSRRAFLRAAGGTAAVAGTSGVAAAEPLTVEVGPDARYVFSPGTETLLHVPPGTTVRFAWRSDNHNVVVENQPSAADWSGHEPIEHTGFSFEHTFDVPGSYEFFCRPHRSMGMTGTIIVGEDGSGASEQTQRGQTGGGSMLALGTLGSLGVVLGLIYVVLRRGPGGPD